MIKRFIVLSILLFSAVLAIGECGAAEVPRPVGWVNDFAGVIPAEYRDKLAGLIEELEAKTSAEIMVVTVGSIAPYDEKDYARLVFDKWKPGKRGKDNGVLILLALKERRWRIETGYGVEAILPDGLCGDIGRNYMVPYFKSGKYGEGLYFGAARIADVIAKDAHVELDTLKGLRFNGMRGRSVDASALWYVILPIFFFVWSLPWPIFISLPFVLIFAAAFSNASPLCPVLIIGGYIASLIVRYNYWSKQSPGERHSFFGSQTYGGTFSSGGGFGGGGFGGGGGGGGGGAGGGF